MSLYRESGIEIDLSRASAHEKHDQINRAFTGVDFVVEEPERQIWLEMKSWSPRTIPPRRRGGARRSYLSKMGAFKQRGHSAFATEMQGKFLGTCAFQTLTGQPPRTAILFVLLLESTPDPGDTALRGHLMTRMRNLLPSTGPQNRPWKPPVRIDVAVVDIAEWNTRFPEYPTKTS